MIFEKDRVEHIEDIEDFYILGLPIETRIGYCYFLKVKDYPHLQRDIQLVSWTKLHFINEFSKDKANQELVETLKKMSLLEIVLAIPEITSVYSKVFTYFFKNEQAFRLIENEKEFKYLRSLILRLSCIKEEEINPNPEIQRTIERSRRIKAQEGESLTFTDIVTSVSAIKGVGYEEICEMTLYQLYMDFHRIAQDKSYQASTLFATVAEKVDIESWSKSITLFEEEKYGLTRNEFSQIAGTIKD